MKERCPEASFLGKAYLDNYKIDFRIFSKKRNCGCADIIKQQGSRVWGLLFQMSDADLARMDAFEGHPKHYRRCKLEVIDENKKKYQAYSYEVVNKSVDTLKPSKHYLNLMQQAAIQFNFPDSYKDFLTQFNTSD